MKGTITGALGLTDDGGLVLQLAIADQGQVNDLRCRVDGSGVLPWRATIRGATWHKPHPLTTPATFTAVFGHGCSRKRYTGKVEGKTGGVFDGWSTVALFDWQPGQPSARLEPGLAVPRATRPRGVAPQRTRSAKSRRGDRLGRMLSWIDRLGG